MGKYFRALEHPSPVGAPWESLGEHVFPLGTVGSCLPLPSTQALWEACFPPRVPGRTYSVLGLGHLSSPGRGVITEACLGRDVSGPPCISALGVSGL